VPADQPADRPDVFDLLVLGAGSGGYAAALRAAQLGLSVALVERDRLGGTCLHRGCIPTKALLHVAETADAVRDAAELGLTAQLERVDMPAALAFAARTVRRLHGGLEQLIRGRGIRVLRGTGRLVGADAVEVDGDDAGRYRARHLVVATGSRPRRLPGVEVDGQRVLTSDDALQLERVPDSAVVLGGGVIGVEFAGLWRSLGATVTVVEALDRLLPAEDEASSSALHRAWRRRGIDVRTGMRVAGVDAAADGVTVQVAAGPSGPTEQVRAEVALVAVGRVPVTDGLGLDAAGVACDRGFVRVDDRLSTTAPGVWAVGDVVSGLQLAHRGFAHGVAVAERVAAALRGTPEPAPTLPDRLVPRIAYCDPEVASVGYTEAAATEEFGADAVRSVTYPLSANGRSLVLGSPGQVKVVRRVDGPVLGVHAVGRRVGELMGEAGLIVGWDAYPEDVTPFVHPHPTQSEAVGEALLALAGQPLHL